MEGGGKEEGGMEGERRGEDERWKVGLWNCLSFQIVSGTLHDCV